MDEWVTVCAECLNPVRPAVFAIPAAAGYGLTQDYTCEVCGHYGKPIQLTVETLKKIRKQKESKVK